MEVIWGVKSLTSVWSRHTRLTPPRLVRLGLVCRRLCLLSTRCEFQWLEQLKHRPMGWGEPFSGVRVGPT